MAMMEEMMMKEQMAAAPEMPPMEGANMDPMSALPPEAREAMMQPDTAIQGVLLARLSNFTPQELEALDQAINPETAAVLYRTPAPGHSAQGVRPDRSAHHTR